MISDLAGRVLHRSTCVALGALLLVGCTRWRVQDVVPGELVATRHPDRVRITRVDRSRIELRQPRLVGDTIYDGRSHRGERPRVLVADVEEVAVRKLDPLGTAAVMLGTAALGAVVAIGLLWSSRAD